MGALHSPANEHTYLPLRSASRRGRSFPAVAYEYSGSTCRGQLNLRVLTVQQDTILGGVFLAFLVVVVLVLGGVAGGYK